MKTGLTRKTIHECGSFYLILKNLVLRARSERYGSAWRIAGRVWSEL